MHGLHKTPRVEKIIFYAFHSIYRRITPKLACTSLRMTATVVKTGYYIFPDTQTGLQELHRTSTVVKNHFNVQPDKQTGLHELRRTSTVVKIVFYALLILKEEACTSFNEPPYRWKLLYGSFLALKMSCHSFTIPPQWWKLLFGSLWTLKLVWPSFISGEDWFLHCSWHTDWPSRASQDLHRDVNCIHFDTQTGMYEFHRTSAVVKLAFSVSPDTQTGMHELHRTFIVVKIIFYAFLNT